MEVIPHAAVDTIGIVPPTLARQVPAVGAVPRAPAAIIGTVLQIPAPPAQTVDLRPREQACLPLPAVSSEHSFREP